MKYIPQKYRTPILILGTAALLVFILGRVFDSLTRESVESGDASVLVQALPFIARFVTIILLFILLIFIIALRFNGKMPYRTYRPVELLIILGIALGVVALFQPWEIVSYKYGFLLLLASTIAFILWSHVKPQNIKLGVDLPPFEIVHHVISLIVGGGIIFAIITIATNSIQEPAPPYSYTQRIWDRGLREEQRVAEATKAEHNYDYTLYTIRVFSLLPGFIFYFITREVVAAFLPRQHPSASSAGAWSHAP